MNPATGALILGDLQNDFVHADGAYGVRIDEAPISPAGLFQLIRASNAEATNTLDAPRKDRAVG